MANLQKEISQLRKERDDKRFSQMYENKGQKRASGMKIYLEVDEDGELAPWDGQSILRSFIEID